jgi:hypothetical protein
VLEKVFGSIKAMLWDQSISECWCSLDGAGKSVSIVVWEDDNLTARLGQGPLRVQAALGLTRREVA